MRAFNYLFGGFVVAIAVGLICLTCAVQMQSVRIDNLEGRADGDQLDSLLEAIDISVTKPSLPTKTPVYHPGQRVYIYTGRWRGHEAELGTWDPDTRSFVLSRVLRLQDECGELLCTVYENEIVSSALADKDTGKVIWSEPLKYEADGSVAEDIQ